MYVALSVCLSVCLGTLLCLFVQLEVGLDLRHLVLSLPLFLLHLVLTLEYNRLPTEMPVRHDSMVSVANNYLIYRVM